MAKEKTLSPAEKLAAEIKANGVKRKKAEGPRYYFPENTLKRERERLGLKINQAATGAGVNPSTLGAMEKGDNPSLAYAMRVAMFYDKPVEKLFGNLVLDERPKVEDAKVSGNETVEIQTERRPFDAEEEESVG